MKKELVITAIIILAIIVANCITQNYTKKCVSEISVRLKDLKNEALNEEIDNMYLVEQSEDIYQDWVNKSEKLSYYLEHNELEKVHSQIKIAKGHFESDEVSSGVSELENCIYILEHIEEKMAFKLKNIF